MLNTSIAIGFLLNPFFWEPYPSYEFKETDNAIFEAYGFLFIIIKVVTIKR
jgi:hypothetical protein